MGHKATPGQSKRGKKNPPTESKNGKQEESFSAPPGTPMGSMGPVAPKNPDLICPHLTYVRLEKLRRKILTPTAWSCSECGTTEGVWACLTCGKIGCGRYQSEHALTHYEDYQHPLALEINLSYCYCYQCDQYVTQDNKKEDLETIRKMILKAQTVDDGTSTTRSGKAIRPPVKIPTSSEFQEEDRLHTAVRHWRLATLGKAFGAWKSFISEQRRQKQLQNLQSPELTKTGSRSSSISLDSPSPSTTPASDSPANNLTPPPIARVKTNFLTQSTQRALASPSSSRIVPGITGLRNLGNTCFMNTVLQALSNTSEFRDFFVHMLGATQPKEEDAAEEVKEKGDGKKTEKGKGKGKGAEANDDEDVLAVVLNGKRYTRQPTLQLLDTIRKHVPKLEEVSLAMEVHSLLRVLWSGKWAVVTPCALLESVWKFVPKFRNRQQQDAQEFLCYLFDRLQLELAHANSALGPAPTPALPSTRASARQKAKDKDAEKESQKGKDAEPEKESDKGTTSRRKRGRSPSPPPATLAPIPLSGDEVTIITETFQGKLCSMVTCDVCKNTSTKLDPFLDLDVDIPVVSIAKPHRRKRKKTTTTKAKPKAKTKQNGTPKAEEDVPSPTPTDSDDKANSPDKLDTTEDTKTNSKSKSAKSAKTDTNKTDKSNKSDSSKTDKSDKTNNTDKTDEIEEAENANVPSASTPPTSATSDSDTEQGPLSCQLSDCLASFIKAERVDGYACEKCGEKREAAKRLFLHTLPHVLCIVLKRFAWTATSRAKIDTHVAIPFTLDVSDYMMPLEKKEKEKKGDKEKPRGMYELKSVVMHHGAGLLSGHYTSYCYNELQDTWVHYNDARVSIVPREQVEREIPSQAYLMFYQRTFPPITPFFPPIFPLLPSSPPPPSPPPSPPASPYAPPPPATTTSRAKRVRK